MVLAWTAATIGLLAAAAAVLWQWYRWQVRTEAARLVRAIEAGDIGELAFLWAERAHAARVRRWLGDPPLIVAARRSGAAARWLVERGAEVDEPGAGWMTALMHAAAAGDAGLCRFLLEHGADPDVRDAFGRPAEWWAERGGHDDVVRLLRRDRHPELR